MSRDAARPSLAAKAVAPAAGAQAKAVERAAAKAADKKATAKKKAADKKATAKKKAEAAEAKRAEERKAEKAAEARRAEAARARQAAGAEKAKQAAEADRQKSSRKLDTTVSGTRYTTAAVNVRSGPDADSDRITTLAAGRKVRVSDEVEDGFRLIVRNGDAQWVRSTFLSTSKPEVKREARSSNGRGGDAQRSGSGSGLSDARCSTAAGIEGGITAKTARVLRAVCNRFPEVKSYGGYRADANSAHGSGRAIDAMVSGSGLGSEIARWVRSNASELGVTEVIWSRQIWTTQRSGEGWRGMSDRGSASANHEDHVHITVG